MDLDKAGLAAARRFALWHIGDSLWADEILAAYANPEETIAQLNKEKRL